MRAVLFPFMLAFILAYFVNPLIQRLVDNDMPRMGALIFVVGVLMALSGFIVVTVLPAVINELDILTAKLPTYVEQVEKMIRQFNQRYQKIDIPPTINLILERLITRIKEFLLQFIERTSEVILNLLSRIFSLVMAPVLAFYILKDWEELKDYFWSLLPCIYHDEVDDLLIRINEGVFAFLRGQLIVSILVGIFSTVGLIWFNVKFSLLIGILAGILNMIPYFGPIIGALPAVIVASFTSLNLMFKVTILFFIIQQIEGNIISPKIMGEKVGLHPILIIFSLLAGGELLGIVGMIIAIPAATIIKEVFHYILLSVDNSSDF